MRSVGTISIVLIAFQATFSLECQEPESIPFDSAFARILYGMQDSSVSVRRNSAKELKTHADRLGRDSRLYDSLVSYALENLSTYYQLKFSEGFDWFNSFQAPEMPAVCRRYQKEKNIELKRVLLLALEGKRLAISEAILEDAFNDPDSTIRVESIRIYGKNKFDGGFKKLESMLDSGGLLKKVGAVRGLSYYKDAAAVSLILQEVLLKENQLLPHDFTLVPMNMVSLSAEYIIDTTTPRRGKSLHDEAYCSIEDIIGTPTEKKVGKVNDWLGTKPSRERPKAQKKRP